MVAAGFPMPQAQTIVHLLIGFDDEERARPATYAMLLSELEHAKPMIRSLAHWHLVRLAPEGKSIAYDPSLVPAQSQAAIAAWRLLIPAGQVPSPKR